MRRASSPRLSAAPRPRLPLLLLASTVLIGLVAVSCDDEGSSVALGSAVRSSVAEVVDAPGSVTARAAATVSAPADGTLARLRVGPGDQVKSGQILAVIDSPAARGRLKQAKQALDAANRAGAGVGGLGDLRGTQRATDAAAAREFAAAREAAGKVTDERLRSALLAQVDAAQRQYRVATRAAGDAADAVRRGVAGLNSAVRALSAAQRLQAQQAYDLARSTVDALTLRAPIAGVVQLGGTGAAGSADALAGLLDVGGGLPDLAGAGLPGAPAGVDDAVPVGGQVTAGTPILTVVDLSELGLVAEVDETDVLLVDAGVTASVELDAATGAAYPAQVRSVDVLPTTSTRGGVSYRVRLSLAPGTYGDGRPAPAPRPGMSALVSLRVREVVDAVTVPAAAVFSTGGRDTVWVVRDGRAEQVVVQLGVQGQEQVQIVSGVQAGQELVVSGTDQVETGQRLR